MARSYNTIPALDDDALAPKKTKSFKGLVAGAALASFVLGVLAMTAVRAPTATPLANLSKDGSKCTCPADTSKTYTDLKACLDQCHDGRASKTSRMTITLDAGNFFLEEQYKIPQYTTIQGTIENKEFASYVFAAKPNPHGNDWGSSPSNEGCNDDDPLDGRIGFILGDHTVVRNLGYVAQDQFRFCQRLFGGFVFETPGCVNNDCSDLDKPNYYIKSREGKDYITDATVDNIFITGIDPADYADPSKKCMYNDWSKDECGGAPQGSVMILQNRNWKNGESTNNVKISSVTMLKSWADSLNVHGAARDITIESNTFWFAGDDNLGIWSSTDPKAGDPGLTNIKLIGNDLSQVRSTTGDQYPNTSGPNWGSCVAVYGLGDELIIDDNICRGRFDATKQEVFTNHGAITFTKLCDSDFPDPAHVWIRGTRFVDHDDNRNGYPNPEKVPLLDPTTISEASARGNFNDVPGPAQPYVEWVPFDEQNVGRLVLNNCPMVKTDSARWQDADHYGAPDASYITQDCTNVEWKHDGTKEKGWYCADKQDPGKPVFFDIDGYHHKGKKLSYANSCIHFDCQAGAGYNKDMKMWQCLDDF